MHFKKFLFYMLIMNKMHQLLPLGLLAHQEQILLLALQPELHLYGGQLMVEQMKRP
jgi:hypothetical protein